MNMKVSLVLTSIAGSDNPVLKEYATACSDKNIEFVVAGDKKSPADFNLPGCRHLDLAAQKSSSFVLATLLPDNTYAKKNIGYLYAIKYGAEIIVESDDDNLPYPEFWENRNPMVNGELSENKSWVNLYAYFSDKNIWPRGLSLHAIKNSVPSLKPLTKEVYSPVQQGLADENPDVDAIYRLCLDLPFYFKKRAPVILANESVCPFNSQNTTWFKPAFALLYLPSYCSFRMTDIWRSFIAQRLLWTCDWHLSFHNATVYQKRNEHNLLKDFEQEISGYLNNDQIMEDLRQLNLKKGEAYLFENLRHCYEALTDKGYIGKEELPLLDAWISDLQAILT